LDGFITKFISAEDYLEKALPNIEERFGKLESLFTRSKLGAPASTDYHPEIDTSNFLDEECQSYVGIFKMGS